MGLLLSHVDLMPLVYGIIMFFGIWSMWVKLVNFRLLALAVELGVFILVFRLHGGTMAGGFSAMTCALISGAILPRTLRR